MKKMIRRTELSDGRPSSAAIFERLRAGELTPAQALAEIKQNQARAQSIGRKARPQR